MRMLENGVFEGEYTTSFTQTGMHDELTNKSFLLLMENLAEAHSSYCNFSFNDLAKENATWVILAWKLRVFKRPEANEKVKVQTWGRFFNKVYVLRDFKFFNDKGELCAIATSKWCLLDTVKGRIAKMPENLDKIYMAMPEESVFNIKDLPRLFVPEGEPEDSDKYRIRRFDLDLNHHVHNLNYLNFAYEVIPMDVYMGEELNNVEIAYKKEIKYGETINSFLYVEDNKNDNNQEFLKDGINDDAENKIYTIVIKDESGEIVHSIVKLYN